MSRYNAIQIGSIYLTSTGLSGGKPCKTTVTGLSKLLPQYRKNIIKAIDGNPVSQIFPGFKGIDLEVTIDWLESSVFDNLNTAFDNSDNTQTPISIVIAGAGGTFSVDVIPGVDYVDFEKFSGTILENVKYRMVTV